MEACIRNTAEAEITPIRGAFPPLPGPKHQGKIFSGFEDILFSCIFLFFTHLADISAFAIN